MFKRVLLFASVAVVASPATAQPTPPAPAAQASVPVPSEVLDRYVGRYELNGAILTIGLSGDGRLTAELSGQPPGPPLRTVSANEFAVDTIGARLLFEGEGPKATRVRSRYAGSEVIGSRIPDGAVVALGPPGPRPIALDAAARREVVNSLGTALRQRYVFPDAGERAAARIDAALATGEYDTLADPAALAARLSADVSAAVNDKHLSINAMGAGPPPPPPGAMAMPRSEAGVVRADMLTGGIGYVEVVAFPRRQGFKPVIDPVMTSLAESKALIVDLRRNIGGMPEGVAYLVSFLLPPGEAVHINDIVTRDPGTDDLTRESFFSQPTPVSFADRPVYVLTSGRTFSGGEGFAYDAKALGRAVLVGETTGGGANPTGPVPLGNGLIASIPVARAENAITGTNWEGRGVDPDVAVPAADALGVVLQRLGQEAATDIAAASQRQVFAPRTVALPGSEAALRAIVTGVTKDPPDLSVMGAPQADMLRPQLPQVQAQLRSLGEIASVRFRGPGLPAGDAFDVTFANGAMGMTVMLGADGLLIGWQMGPGAPGN